MGTQSAWMIYGANGYTGRLVAAEAKRQGLQPILAGRNAEAVRSLAAALQLDHRIFDLADPPATRSALEGMRVVAHCAGPFSATSRSMISACFACRTHYLDITGEIPVFLDAESQGQAARQAGIVLCPGVGFDVIPTDCVAAVLKEELPDAADLALGIDAAQIVSPGTAKTVAESAHMGGQIRKDGRIVQVPLGHSQRRIDFGNGEKLGVSMPWGDIATAYFSTGIPNIVVYFGMPPSNARILRAANWLQPVLRFSAVRSALGRLAHRQSHGPSEQQLRDDVSYVWGEARNAAGQTCNASLTAPNGYRLTANGTVMAARYLLEQSPAGGYYTPSRLLGSRCVERLPDAGQIRIQRSVAA